MFKNGSPNTPSTTCDALPSRSAVHAEKHSQNEKPGVSHTAGTRQKPFTSDGAGVLRATRP
ncbi:hypothetical protein D2E23_0151 [Bifidobacterium callimiconis]|uniref:Uncharacterized protein n=1 Tax=Bifidobacterium callimiconis TaxID=2306973 RepID=A0A430FHQ8_9BIFI|nr:hypothetical protein D2E23_0151 [Bifidobacterium callimiconis]